MFIKLSKRYRDVLKQNIELEEGMINLSYSNRTLVQQNIELRDEVMELHKELDGYKEKHNQFIYATKSQNQPLYPTKWVEPCEPFTDLPKPPPSLHIESITSTQIDEVKRVISRLMEDLANIGDATGQRGMVNRNLRSLLEDCNDDAVHYELLEQYMILRDVYQLEGSDQHA